MTENGQSIKLNIKKANAYTLAFKLLIFVYFKRLSNNSVNCGEEGLAASALITFPFGSINKNLGIESIPNALIKSEFQFLSANN